MQPPHEHDRGQSLRNAHRQASNQIAGCAVGRTLRSRDCLRTTEGRVCKRRMNQIRISTQKDISSTVLPSHDRISSDPSCSRYCRVDFPRILDSDPGLITVTRSTEGRSESQAHSAPETGKSRTCPRCSCAAIFEEQLPRCCTKVGDGGNG